VQSYEFAAGVALYACLLWCTVLWGCKLQKSKV
jgi:hypothetical protein